MVTEDTPAAIVYKASWPEEAVYQCTVGTLAATAREKGVARTALIVVGRVLDTGKDSGYERSRLYAPEFDTMFRNGSGRREIRWKESQCHWDRAGSL